MTFQRLTIAFTLTAIVACARSATTPDVTQTIASAPLAPLTPPKSSANPSASSAPSASVRPAASAARAGEVIDVSDDDLHRAMRDDHPTPSPEVEAEAAYFDKTYEALPPLRQLPDFLSVDAVVALMTDDSETQYLRDGIHEQLGTEREGPLFGKYLDEQEERLFLLWLQGHMTQVLAVFDGKRLASKRLVSRGQTVVLGDVVSEKDTAVPEVLIERITSMSVCCLPMGLEVLRVGKQGQLREVLNFPRGHVDVGPGVAYGFLNHFEFKDDHVVVRDVLSTESPRYELVFDVRSGRFQPTPATAKILRAEKRARGKAEAEGNYDPHGSYGVNLAY